MARRAARDLLEFVPFRLGLALLGALPFPVADDFGAALGELAYRLLGSRRRVALENLERVFGRGLSEGECRRIARGSFHSLGRLVAGFSQLPRIDRAWVSRHVAIEGWERLVAARAQGKGVLILAAHFGPWELIPMVQAALGQPMAFIVRPADNQRVEATIRRYRERLGNGVIAKRQALRECLQRLRRAETVGILIDQHVPADRGVPTLLLGQPTHTVSALAALALRTGAPVVPAFASRTGRGRLRIVYGEPVPPSRGAGRDADLLASTERYVAVVDEHIRASPEQWLWSHRRFR